MIMNEISDAKLKAFILVGTIGITVILSAKIIFSILHKSVDAGSKLIGLFENTPYSQ